MRHTPVVNTVWNVQKKVSRRQDETDTNMAELKTIVDRLNSNFKQWQTDYMPLDSQELKEKLYEVDQIQKADHMHQRELETVRTQ